MAGSGLTRTELVWPGKYEEDGKRREVPRVNLPFQVIERVNESRASREAVKERGATLFDVWEGDEGETFEQGWRNKLIWGDNLLVMSSLLEQFASRINLIYMDPPFATGSDFSMYVPIGEEGAETFKEQSVVEEKAYRDTWGGGTASFITMISDRLSVAKELLHPSGSIVVHIDAGLGHVVRLVLDEVFGGNNFLNEIIWSYSTSGRPSDRYPQKHDNLLWYRRTAPHAFYPDQAKIPYTQEYLDSHFTEVDDEGRRCRKRFDAGKWRTYYPEDGMLPNDVWDIPYVNSQAVERTGFPTQKPEPLLERLIKATTVEGNLVADFFCGSGTTMAAAEKLGRRWIGCDLGRYALHISRKRLLGIAGSRPFDVLNHGKYERQYWSVATFGEDLDDDGAISLLEYVAFILRLYGATPTSGGQHLHGKTGDAFVHVGAVDAPVTFDEVTSAVGECAALKARELHILGWEWEMGLNDLVSDEAKKHGVKVMLRQIPREVMETEAARKGDVRFFELAYLEATVKPTKNAREFRVSLENFVIPNPELVPDDVREKITKWSDFVDYWAVDWDFRDDTFMQGWVTYRTRRDRSLELVSDPHVYDEPGEYRVMIKVIDVFGNDTSKLVTISVD